MAPKTPKASSPAMKAIFTAIVNACGFGGEYVQNSIKALQKRLDVSPEQATLFELLNWEGDISRQEIETLLRDVGTDYTTQRGLYDDALATHRGSLVG